jgi:hypothetical protein
VFSGFRLSEPSFFEGQDDPDKHASAGSDSMRDRCRIDLLGKSA